LQQKWGLKPEGYLDGRENTLNSRHSMGIVRPIVAKIPVIGRMAVVQKAGRKVIGPQSILPGHQTVSHVRSMHLVHCALPDRCRARRLHAG